MTHDELLRSGRIRKESISKKEIEHALELAERDLRAARKLTAAEQRDWAFAIAYNAVLQTCRAYMFSQGYRPAGAEAHKNTLAFVQAAFGREHQELLGYFDRVRKKRHQAVYDQAGLISQTEARTLIAKAAEFVVLIRQELETKR